MKGFLRFLVVSVVLSGLIGNPATPAAAAEPADIVVNYNGFSDNARTAFEYAVRRWERMITSPVQIRVRVTWKNLGPGALGHAGPSALVQNGVWMPQALANAKAGSDQMVDVPDINGEFNKELDNWYFGTDGDPPAGKFDFASIVMHELGHGLGFGGWMSVNEDGVGSWGLGSGYAGIYDRFTETKGGKRLLSYDNPSTALGKQLTGGALYWRGAKGVAYNGGSRPRLYAPATWWHGSSYMHLNESTYPAGSRNSLMTPHVSVNQSSDGPGPIVLGMLRDMGWKLGPAGQALVDRLTILQARTSDTAVSEGGSVTITGTLRKAETGAVIASRSVTLYRRPVGATSWTKGSTKTTETDGTVAFVQTPGQDMQYQLRHAGSATTDADRSPIRRVDVSG